MRSRGSPPVDLSAAAGPRVLNERAFQFEARGQNPWLSVKCMFNGGARYAIGRRRISVDAQSFLLLNQGTPYTISIDSRTQVESFVVFFPPDWAARALRQMTSTHEELLDEPFADSKGRFSFIERLYPHHGPCSALIFKLIRLHKQGALDRLHAEALHLELMSELVASQKPLLRRVETLPWKKQSTRMELFRRVQHGKDYIHASWRAPITVESAAAAASLSTYHFARAFKEIMGAPPHAYIRRLRLQRARSLLDTSDLSVLEVSQEVGFESPTAFAGAFRKAVGRSPRAYRQERRGARNKQE